MLAVDAGKRYTVDQCLSHRWFVCSPFFSLCLFPDPFSLIFFAVFFAHFFSQKDASGEKLGDVAEALKDYQAKKKLKGAILGVMAAGKMKNLLGALKGKREKEKNVAEVAWGNFVNDLFCELCRHAYIFL